MTAEPMHSTHTGSETVPASAHTSASTPPASGTAGLRILLYSDDSTTRDRVRLAVGKRPARDVSVDSWFEVATGAMALEAASSGAFDLLVLDGEAGKVGGMGLSRQLKNEVYDCPPVLILTGRAEDAWLAAWSLADLAVPQPLDPIALAAAVAELGRRRRASRPATV